MYITIIIYTRKFIQQLYILKISITIASLLYIYICLISGMVAINVALKTKKHTPFYFLSQNSSADKRFQNLKMWITILDGNSHFKTGRWFSTGNPVSSTNKTIRHNITKIKWCWTPQLPHISNTNLYSLFTSSWQEIYFVKSTHWNCIKLSTKIVYVACFHCI